jgi:predicted MFS family arabinose efflux permease
MTGAGFEVAALWICLFGPSVALAAHAGLLVDRVETTRLLAVVSAVGAAAALAAGLFAGTALVALLALTVVLGAIFAISQPAEFALVPLLAGTDRAQEANGHVETARYIGFGLGPLVGGVAFAFGGLGLAMAIDALTFALVAVAATRLSVRREPGAAGGDGRSGARAGIAVLLDDRVLRLVMIVAFSSLLFMSAVWVAELFFVEDVLGRGDVAYGFMFSVWTAGMALGALAISRRVVAAAVAAAGLLAVAVQGLGLALPAVWLGFGFFCVCAFAGGLAHGVKNVMFRSLIHQRVPERLHGRAFAAFNGLRNTAELAAFAGGGLLVATIGARGTLLYAGMLSALAGLIGLAVLLRRNYGWVSTSPVGPPSYSSSSVSASA